jgi:predicted metal-dependent hydrolase
MKRTFRYGGYAYEYFVEFNERKTFTLVVRPDLRIITRAPLGATIEEIEAFLRRKWKWLEKQLRELRKYKKPSGEGLYVSGKSMFYLGRQYVLEVVADSNDIVKLERGKLRVYTTKNLRNSDHNKKLIDAWYAEKRGPVFKQQYLKAYKLFNYDTVPRLGERSMARRWGSYTSDGKVLLNPRLIEAPREAIYYVCVHELCHKVSGKHDEIFYRELSKRLPGWRMIKESLEIRFG